MAFFDKEMHMQQENVDTGRYQVVVLDRLNNRPVENARVRISYMSTSYVSYTKPIFEVIKIPKILEKSSFFACVESKCVI